MFQASVLQGFFVEFHYRVRVVHLSSDRRGRHVLVVWMLTVFLGQQVGCVLLDTCLTDVSVLNLESITSPLGLRTYCLLTEIVLWPVSRSGQRSATNSPFLSPLTSSRQNMGRTFLAFAAVRQAFSCSGRSAFISTFCTLGVMQPSVGVRGMSLSLTARSKVQWRVR